MKLDWDIGDRIALKCLKNAYKILKKQNKMYSRRINESGDDTWFSDQILENRETMSHLKVAIEYFGGTVK